MRIALLLVAGCRVSAPSVATPFQVKTPTLEITDSELAHRYSSRTVRTALPFAFDSKGVNGTQLMLQFLDYAEQHGARYVSDLAIRVQMVHEGTPVECVSTVVFEGDLRLASHPAPAPSAPDPSDDASYTTTIRPWRPPTVTAYVDDHDYVCSAHADQVTVEELNIPDRFDVSVARYVYPEQVHMIETQEVVWHDECQLEPRHREVTRYEHFVAAHFEPPDWDRLSRAYAERRLIELPPECHRIPTPTHGTVQQVEADLSYQGGTQPEDKQPPRRPRWR